jgi:hypothetical protein
MIVILSGEGPTDLGQCNNAQGQCRGANFAVGPMTVVLDWLIEQSRLGYSLFGITDGYRFVSEKVLKARVSLLRQNKKSVSLVGKKRGEETGYFYINAWMLGEIANEYQDDENDSAIAVLFRDCDGTRSSKDGIWQDKWNSMLQGFRRAQFERGVPMLPKPKSEAWLLCAAKEHPYQNCADLENDLSGNDASPNSAKSQLKAVLADTSAHGLKEWVETQMNVDRIDMPSFNEFKNRLLEVIGSLKP